jgi:hypothetical protein
LLHPHLNIAALSGSGEQGKERRGGEQADVHGTSLYPSAAPPPTCGYCG